MQKIVPCFWFDNQAEEAVKFYTSLFKYSKVDEISYYGDEGYGQKGNVLAIKFQLSGQDFMAINGGPEFKFTPALSLYVNCEGQEEVDYYWEKLSDGGEKGQCGWLTDKYGVSWQIVPTILNILLNDKDEKKAKQVMHAMLQMKKLDIQKLKEAYQQA